MSTPRQRVLNALAHNEPERVPRDLGGTESSGMTARALHNLQRRQGESEPLRIFEPYQYVATTPESVRRRFRIDTANLTREPRRWVGSAYAGGLPVQVPENWREEAEADGTVAVRGSDGEAIARRPEGSHYFDPVNPPLRHCSTSAELERHRQTIQSSDAPAFADESDEAFRARAGQMHAAGDCVVFNLCCHILAAGQLLRGYETFMVDLMTDEPMARTLLDILIEGYLERIDHLANLLPPHVDVVLLNDDLGIQQGPMLSPDTYRRLIKPYQNTLFSHVKEAFGAPLLFHSCGAVREFIPDLVEIGVDALNPVQISAQGMKPQDLKRDFGDTLTFWGGGVDTQTVLNHGTPAEVADAVHRNVDTFAPGGGFVFCQVHNIQPDVPPENVVAMFDALDSCSGR